MLLMPETLTTERLHLRRPIEADMEAFIAFYMSDRSSMAMGPMDRAGAFGAFCTEVSHWSQKGFGNYTVVAEGAAVGLIGLWQPKGFPERELGWLLWEGAEGKGYATEGAAAVRDAAEAAGLPTPVSYIDTQNEASKSVARRLGARFECFKHGWDGTEVWRHRGAA